MYEWRFEAEDGVAGRERMWLFHYGVRTKWSICQTAINDLEVVGDDNYVASTFPERKLQAAKAYAIKLHGINMRGDPSWLYDRLLYEVSQAAICANKLAQPGYGTW